MASYRSLARQYRPQTFADLMGQDAVSQALANAIAMGREPHAVLFSGIRGVGKTTTARLYAKALNCGSGPTPSPCGNCDSCKAIENGVHEDVLEIDGASNTGVDDVRVLRETVNYVPRRSKFRIILIDEVHMLSQSAFNALLKTLEEPPSHVVFVFATTELQKIPATILSRCQVFKLAKFQASDIVQRLQLILTKEGIAFEEEALRWVAREGRGSMRDALTFLDQVIVLGDGCVTMNALRDILGATHEGFYTDLLHAFITKKMDVILAQIELYPSSNYIALTERLVECVRDILVLKHTSAKPQATDDDAVSQLRELAAQGELLDWNRIFRWLCKCRMDLDGSYLDRFIVENYGLEWCLDPGLPQSKVIAPRQAATAQPIKLGQIRSELAKQQDTVAEKPPVTPVLPTVESPADLEFPPTWRELVQRWKKQKPMQARILEEVFVDQYSQSLISMKVIPESMAASKLLQPAIRAKVKEAFREMFGFEGELRIEEKHAASEDQNLLQLRQKEKQQERDKKMEDAKMHPATQAILQHFDARIDSIQVD